MKLTRRDFLKKSSLGTGLLLLANTVEANTPFKISPETGWCTGRRKIQTNFLG